VLQRWYELGVLSSGECWAEWDGRLMEVEKRVRRTENAREIEGSWRRAGTLKPKQRHWACCSNDFGTLAFGDSDLRFFQIVRGLRSSLNAAQRQCRRSREKSLRVNHGAAWIESDD